ERVIVDATSAYASPLAACASLLETLKPLLEGGASSIVLVTRGAVAARPGEGVPSLAASALWGLWRTARNEHPDRELLAVDLAPRHRCARREGPRRRAPQPRRGERRDRRARRRRSSEARSAARRDPARAAALRRLPPRRRPRRRRVRLADG